MVLNQMNFQVSAWALVTNVLKARLVQEIFTRFQGGIVSFPGQNRVVQVRAGRRKNVLPKFGHAFFFR